MPGWIEDNGWSVSMPRWRGVQICHSGLDPESSSFEAHEFPGLPLTPIRDYRGRRLLLGFIWQCMIITGKKIFHEETDRILRVLPPLHPSHSRSTSPAFCSPSIILSTRSSIFT